MKIIFFDIERVDENTMVMLEVSLDWLKKLDDIWMMVVMELPMVHFHAILLTSATKKIIAAAGEKLSTD